MPTIAKLNTVVSGDASGFNAAMNGIQERANGAMKGVGAAFNGLVIAGRSLALALLPIVPIIGTIGAASNAVDTYKFARSIGVAASEVEGLRQALKSSGGEASQAESIFASLATNIATLGKGNVEFAGTLDRIGIDAKRLASMSAPQAFEEIISALASIEDRNKRAALAYQLFGKDAAAALQIVEKGADTLKKAGGDAQAMGLALKDSKLAQIEKGQIAWEKFVDLLHGAALTIASELLPYLTVALDMLPQIGTVASVITEAVKHTIKWSIILASSLVALIAVARMAGNIVAIVILSIGLVFASVFSGIAKVMKLFLETVGLSVPATLTAVANAAGNMMDGIKKHAEGVGIAFDDLTRTFDDIAESMARIDAAATTAGESVDKIGKGGGAVAAANNMAGLFQKGLEVTKEFQSPLQKFNTRMEELNALIEVGAISWDTYSKATHDAVNQLEKAHELQRMGLSAATQAGTVEAYSSILTSQQQDNMSLRETPMERTNRILQDSKEIEKKIAEHTQKTAEAVQSITVVKI